MTICLETKMVTTCVGEGKYWSCRYHFISACCTFRICHMINVIWTLGLCFDVWYWGRVAVTAHMCRPRVIDYVILICFLRFVFSDTVICSWTLDSRTVHPCLFLLFDQLWLADEASAMIIAYMDFMSLWCFVLLEPVIFLVTFELYKVLISIVLCSA